MYWNKKVGSLCGRMLPKLPIVLKTASNKNCIKSNFLQKTQWARMSLSSELGASKDLLFLKYNALEWQWQIFGAHIHPVRFL